MMNIVKNYIEGIKDELCGAQDYAESYIMYQTEHPEWARYYNEMATQELAHAGYLIEIGKEKMGMLKWMSDDDKESWDRITAKVAEKSAIIRLMLSK